MHEQGQAFGVCLAKKSLSLIESLEALCHTKGTEEVVVLDAQLCQVCTQAV